MKNFEIVFNPAETEKLLHGTTSEHQEVLNEFEQKFISYIADLCDETALVIIPKSPITRCFNRIISRLCGVSNK